MDKQQPLDLFHPLTSLEWEKCADLPQGFNAPPCTVLQGRLYIGGGSAEKIFICSPDLSSWTQEATPIGLYGLTTYKSQLVIVGGKKAHEKSPAAYLKEPATNQLWSSPNGKEWSKTIPPMKVQRDYPLAVNPGTPECLIVVGGEQMTARAKVSLVEVFIDGQWFHFFTTPVLSGSMRLCATFHARTLFVRCDTALQEPPFIYCNVDALITTAKQRDKTIRKDLWKVFKIPQLRAVPVSFKNELLSIGGIGPAIAHVYSPRTHAWVEMGPTGPLGVWSGGVTVLPSGELVAVTQPGRRDSHSYLCKAKLKVLPFRLDGEFEAPSESLTKWEAMGLKVCTAMATVDPATLNAVFKDRPSTWRTLLDVLEEINCDELSKKVEAFLTAPGAGIKSLAEMCMSVIMSVLLLKSLEPEVLHSRLPSSLPPYFKSAIRDRFKALTDPISVIKRRQ